jgi:hypothetical protein
VKDSSISKMSGHSDFNMYQERLHEALLTHVTCRQVLVDLSKSSLVSPDQHLGRSKHTLFTQETWRRLRSATNSTRMMTQSLEYVCNSSGGRVRETGDVFLAVLPGLDRKIARLGSPVLHIPSDPFRCRGSATKTTCNKMLMKDGQETYWRVGTIRSTW